jgi:hypothetical protein
MKNLFRLTSVLFVLALAFSTFGSATPRVLALDAVEVVSVDYPHVVEPGNIINFSVTVKINSGQLLESRGDMLRNTDGNLFGHWPHIGVVGSHNAGENYIFVSYGSMVAPSTDGQYTSTWRVWQNAAYVGGNAVINFEVKKGSGGGSPPPYVSQNLTYIKECDLAGLPQTGYVDDENGRHYYIDFEIPNSTGTNKVVIDNTTQMASVSITNGILYLSTLGGFQVGPFIFGSHTYGPWTAPGGPLRVNSPGANEGFQGHQTKVADNHWHVFINEMVLWPDLPTLGLVGMLSYEYRNTPRSLVHLQCKFTTQTVPDQVYYALLNGVSIPAPEIGRRYAYSFDFPEWMTSVSVILRQGSSAKISLRGPDGTIYDASNPNVVYTNTSQYAVLKLDHPNAGQWEALIDVTAAQPDSVFFLNIGGTYGTPTNPDVLAPFTNIAIDAIHGSNSWLVSDARITLTADDAGGSGVAKIEWSIDGGANWNQYSASIIISQEGLTVFTARATDNSGNVEILPPTKYLRIDKTAPEVSVWSDATNYSRVQPFTVHYSGFDPLPGSGLASLTALFNNQPVTDGQVVDLFWLPSGTYTLAVTGQDYAGWVTTNSTTITLIATIPSLQQTVNRLCTENYITKQGTCTSLSQKLASALSAQQRGQNKTAVNVLLAFQNELMAQKGKAVTVQAYNLLMMDSNYVIQVLGGK